MDKKDIVREKLKETSNPRRITASHKNDKEPFFNINEDGSLSVRGDVVFSGKILGTDTQVEVNDEGVRKEALKLTLDALERGLIKDFEKILYSFENYLKTGRLQS